MPFINYHPYIPRKLLGQLKLGSDLAEIREIREVTQSDGAENVYSQRAVADPFWPRLALAQQRVDCNVFGMKQDECDW